MKKIPFTFFFLILCTSSFASPVNHDVHIEWTYDYQPIEGRELLGFKLYQEEKEVCKWDGPTLREGDCVFSSEVGTFDFTLTAYTTDDSESPHSIHYNFELTEKVNFPAPIFRSMSLN